MNSFVNNNLIEAFVDGKIVENDYGKSVLHTRLIGELIVTTGFIVACDPFVFFDSIAFTTQVPIGKYPVILSIERRGEDERVAFAMLKVRETYPVRWEMAVRPDQDTSKLVNDEFFGYPVDAGMGCFADADAASTFLKKLEDEVWTEDYSYSEYMIEEMQKNYVHTWDFGSFSLDETEGNLITFTSGLGDGLYPSYFGFDGADRVTSLVTDFCVVDLQ